MIKQELNFESLWSGEIAQVIALERSVWSELWDQVLSGLAWLA